MEFTERMEAGRDAAALKRHRGQFTGKSAAGWDYVSRDPDKGSFEESRQAVVARWQVDAWLASGLYAKAVFPERYDDDTSLDDVIAECQRAELDAIPF